jgi:hypothetical protein
VLAFFSTSIGLASTGRPRDSAIGFDGRLQRQRPHGVLREPAEAADGVELVTGAEVVSVRPGARVQTRPRLPGERGTLSRPPGQH